MMNPGKKMWIAALAVASVLGSVPATAGPYSDDLSKCLVRSTGDAEKRTLVKWIFAAVALHPEVADISSVTPAQRTEMTRNTAKIFEKLLADSCRTEVQQAVQYEGPQTIGSSFQVLGQVAARELFSNPNVAANMADLGKYIDQKRIAEAMGKAR
ncbi:MAG: hypothetical protein U1E04_04330 [Hylemonella sp.]|jgi:hypothetical protein|nr:hypothetical protein [Hylemonella sp.]